MPKKFSGQGVHSAKVIGGGAVVTPAMLEKINRFALTPLKEEDVYVRKAIVAHSAIDRDNERFPEDLLDDFAATLPGKGYFNNEGGHPGSYGGQHGAGQGLWFDASTEELTPAEFEQKTGEKPRLAPGKSTVKVLWGHFYILKIAENEGRIANIEAGIHRHVSIGFGAASLSAVKDPEDETRVLYWEYKGPGEAREASQVYLGAQPGATVQKCAGCSHTSTNDDNRKGEGLMPWEKKFTDEQAAHAETRKKAADLAVLNTNNETDMKALKDAIGGTADVKTVEELKALAADGKAYRKSLVDEYVRLGRQLGKLPDDPEELKAKTAVVETFPLTHLKDEIGFMRKECREKFPDFSELPGEDGREKRAPDAPEGRLTETGEKDFSDPANNPVIFGSK